MAIVILKLKAGIKITGEEDFNYFLAIVYPSSQLHIFDYNRVLKDLNGKFVKELLAQVSSLLEEFMILAWIK